MTELISSRNSDSFVDDLWPLNRQSFIICWEAKVQKTVEIVASSREEAHRIWNEGEYQQADIDDEDIIGETIDIDNEEYYINKFQKVKRGS